MLDNQYNGQITLLFSERGATVEIYDKLSRQCIVKAELDLAQVGQALSRLAHTDCNITVGKLDRVGKKMESKGFEFPLPKGTTYKNEKEVAKEEVKKLCPEGWTPDLFFDSQTSFYTDSQGHRWASTFIRRWVSPTGADYVEGESNE